MPVSSLYQSVTSFIINKQQSHIIGSLTFLKWTLRKKTINDLPDECLANIFAQILCPSGTSDYTPSLIPFFSAKSRYDPFVLGQVCRKWRNVALRTPELWCSITIIQPKPCHIHRTKLWMQRSGNHTISITLRQSTRPTSIEFEATTALLALFNSRVEFWQSIELYLNGQFPHSILPRLRDLSKMPTSKLNEVTLSLRSRLPASLAQVWNAPTTRFWDILQSIPSITSFNWNAPIVGSAPLGNNISAVEIKTPISMKTLISHITPASETLQSVVIYKLSLTSSCSLRVIEPIVYPKLTVLDITASPITSDVSILLRRITLPSLTYLALAHVKHDIIVHVADLLHRPQCTLEAFDIRIPKLTEPQIMEWLNMDGLEQLTCLVLESPITNNILRALHRPAQYGHQPLYFPKLKRLGLGKCVATIDNGLLLRMLGSRFWTVPYIAGRPKLPATELDFACITVQEVTAEHEAYAEMIKQTAQGSSRAPRELEIMV